MAALLADPSLATAFLALLGLTFVALFLMYGRTNRLRKIITSQSKRLGEITSKYDSTKKELDVVVKKETYFRETLDNTHHTLQSAQSKLVHAEKMSSLGQLTAGIAHEINNPVSFIKGGIQTLKMAIEDLYQIIAGYQAINCPETNELTVKLEAQHNEAAESLVEVKEMVDQLFKDVLFGTERVTEIVNGLRIFSRHDEAKIKSANVHENLNAALMILKHKYKNKAEVIQQYDPQVGNIDCLPGQLNQVFVNLISNAVDAMDDCGTLIISTRDLGDKVQLSFKDNGCGIPDEIKSKIFDPFYSTKDVGEGTGLGLSISHSIIEEHHGRIEVFSELGAGTEFSITLPKVLDIEDVKTEDNHEIKHSHIDVSQSARLAEV